MSDDLTAWLAAPGALDDAQIDAFLARVREEPDAKRASAAVAALIGSPRLSLAQLERVARSDRELMRRHEALIQRTYLARRLETAVSDELLEQVLELKDASIQTKLVRDARLTRKQAERLAKRGANPTLRANAEAWLKDKKAWGQTGRAG
jgi:DNA-binding phage protein